MINLRKCSHCQKFKIVSKILSLCKDCLISEFQIFKPFFQEIHNKTRLEFGLPMESKKVKMVSFVPFVLEDGLLRVKTLAFVD